MSSAVCSHCGCNDIDVDPARGDAVCTGCGSVLEDQIIVSEIQFEENAKGGANVIGQFVSSEGGKAPNLGSGFHAGVGKESRLITLENGKKKIEQVGRQLRLNQHCIDIAFNFFKMAVARRLTRGRRTTHVIAACLYLVCRTEGTSHMLLDFSDVLQVNVYTLGRTYLTLSKELCINIPALDPCLYIQRFAHRLEFGDKEHEVSMTALRLVSRMKRDWMAQGRRPSGLCGAALLVAARLHNFSRNLKDMIKVVRVSETTIRKRLNEFGDTPSGQLTIDEFHNIDLEEEADPPSFTEGKKKAKLHYNEEDMAKWSVEISDIQTEIDKALAASRAKRKGPYAKYAKESVSEGTGSDKEDSICSEILDVSILSDAVDLDGSCDSINSALLKSEQAASNSDLLQSNVSSGSSQSSQNLSQSQERTSSDGQLNCQTESGSAELSGVKPDDKDPDVEQLEQNELDSLLMPPPWGGGGGEGPSQQILRPTAASLGIKDTVEECMQISESTEEQTGTEDGDGELDLSGIDDSELDQFILTPTEVTMKSKIWHAMNADYLQQQKEKAEKLAKEQAEGNVKEKKKRKVKKKQPIQASTAGEAIEKMLQERKISSKINYDVLKDLRKQESSSPVKRKQGAETVLGGTITELKPVTLKPSQRFRKLSLSSDNKPAEVEEPMKKKMKVEEKPAVPAEVVVESGPIEYAKDEDVGLEEDADDYYDDEDEEEEHVSAAKLLGHGVEEDYHDAYDDYND